MRMPFGEWTHQLPKKALGISKRQLKMDQFEDPSI